MTSGSGHFLDTNENRSRLPGRILAFAGVATLVIETLVYALSTRFYGIGAYYLLSLANHSSQSYFNDFVINSSYYPPFYYLFLWCEHQLFGTYFPGFILLGLLFPLLGMGYLYAWGKRVSTPTVAGASVLLMALVPGTVIFTKTLVIEIPLLLFAPAVLYHAAASEAFQNRRHTILLGLFAALGVLTKWTFGGYVLAACLLALVLLPVNRQQPPVAWSKRLVSLLLAAVVLLAIAGPWYIHSFDPSVFQKTASNDPTFPAYDYLRHIEYNWSSLSMLVGRIFLPLLLAIALVVAILRKKPVGIVLWGIGLAAFPLLVFSLPAHLETRYMVPVSALVLFLLPVALGKNSKPAVTLVALLALVAVSAVDHAKAYLPPKGGVYDTPDQILYVNHVKGKLVWGTVQTPALYQRMQQRLTAVKLDKAMVVTHPLWENYHCAYTYLKLFQKADPNLGHYAIHGLSAFQYSVFHEMLHGGEPDFILINCGTTGDCRDRISDLEKPHFKTILGTPYVDQFSGAKSKTFAVADVATDLDVLDHKYELLESYDFDAQGRVNLYAKRVLQTDEDQTQ